MAIPTRKEWQKIRDDAGGKAGETKKVSVGKALDEYHKAAAKYSGEDLLKPLQELEKDLNTYYEAVKKSNPKLAKAVDDELIAEVKKEKREAKAVSGHEDKIQEGVEAIRKLIGFRRWTEDIQKVAGLLRLIRAAADQLADVDPDDRWAQIHRITVLVHKDLEELDKSLQTKSDVEIEAAQKETRETIEDALKAIRKLVK
jgi:hypothetical protein